MTHGVEEYFMEMSVRNGEKLKQDKAAETQCKNAEGIIEAVKRYLIDKYEVESL